MPKLRERAMSALELQCFIRLHAIVLGQQNFRKLSAQARPVLRKVLIMDAAYVSASVLYESFGPLLNGLTLPNRFGSRKNTIDCLVFPVL